MTKNPAKLLIIRDCIQLQLAIQNAYHDEAYKYYCRIHDMTDDFYAQKKIKKCFYNKIKKNMHKYDIAYKELEIRKKSKNINRKAYLLNKGHFED